ncbi:hypothetical protein VNO77_39304 [Canavalia gladiata]|uniref:Sulfotransferase n=1 Tax=Canavalia gladiata TaxID=3824 RepID=A0AAN9KE57_CANGL
MFSKGIISFGPWWSHMLGYWKESIARPNKVLFLKYEDLKEDGDFHVRKIAEFLGCPFTEEEESNGVIKSIIKLCSFKKMKDLEVNKFGALGKNVENKYFFRNAEIGDWETYLSPSMVEKLSKIIEEKKLQINIPLAEALEEMPSYAKFMKELLSKKRRLKEDETVALTEECSAIIQRKLPQKLKDPGSFSIPCTIGNLQIGKALCDLGASINLMPLSIMKKLKIEEVKPTTMCLQLADRSIKHPYGVVEDLLVKVDRFIFPVDFVVLDMEEDAEIPLILGRPFIATGRALIDVQQGQLMLRVQDEKVTFNVFEAMKHPAE